MLQVHIAQEETKFGFDETELDLLMKDIKDQPLANTNISGLMGIASFTDDLLKVKDEFKSLKKIFDKISDSGHNFSVLSMGMSSDYKIAIEEGSNMVRLGSLIFGERNYNQ